MFAHVFHVRGQLKCVLALWTRRGAICLPSFLDPGLRILDVGNTCRWMNGVVKEMHGLGHGLTTRTNAELKRSLVQRQTTVREQAFLA